MLDYTLVGVPHAVDGPHGQRQRNAMGSWPLLDPQPANILVFGDDQGVGELAIRQGWDWGGAVPKAAVGSLNIGWVFRKVNQVATTEFILYVDCDLILCPDVMPALAYVAAHWPGPFCTCAGRYDARIDAPIDYSDPDWAAKLQGQVFKLHPRGSDYAFYRRGMFGEMPDFSIGAGWWDGWRMFEAKRSGKLVNIERVAHAVHQFHGFAWSGHPATGYNKRMAGKWQAYVRDADHWIEPKEVAAWV